MGCGSSTAAGIQRAATGAPKNPAKALCMYARHGNEDSVKKLLSLRHSPSFINGTHAGACALHLAARAGHISVVKQLISARCDIDLQDPETGDSAIHYAAVKGQLAVVEQLIAAGCSLNLQSSTGFTALHLASQAGHAGVTQMLIEARCSLDLQAKDRSTALHMAAIEGHATVANQLISARCAIDVQDENKFTALHLAAKEGKAEVSQMLIEARCSLDVQSEDRSTALHLAAKEGHATVANQLMSMRCAIDVQEENKCTALHLAAKEGKMDVAEYLIAAGASLDFQSRYGDSALHMAEKHGKNEVAALLCRNGARGGLIYAAKTGLQEVVAALITQSHDLNERENVTDKVSVAGATALHYAAAKGQTVLVKQLIAARCDLNLQCEETGCTALHWAALRGQVAVVEQLLAAGCSPEIQDKLDRKTALEYAEDIVAAGAAGAAGGHAEIITKLQRKKSDMKFVKKRSDFEAWKKEEETVLTPDEKQILIQTVERELDREEELGPTHTSAWNKFSADLSEMVIGEFGYAARGIYELLGIEEDKAPELGKNNFSSEQELIKGLEAEIHALNDKEASDLVQYVLHEQTSEKEYANGIRDKGRAEEFLDDFVKHPFAVLAGLNKAEVAALRLYTTAIYQWVNDHLRENNGQPHPLPITVLLIVKALRKLKKVGADQETAVASMTLWRGMRNLTTSDEFMVKGGTERAPMSTTSSLTVAALYSISSESLLFKIVTANNLQRGADLTWVSAFPAEAEILFSPLTFLQPTGRVDVVEVRGRKWTVVEVQPTCTT